MTVARECIERHAQTLDQFAVSPWDEVFQRRRIAKSDIERELLTHGRST